MNCFDKFDWNTMMKQHPFAEYDTEKYHRILEKEIPEFLKKYIQLPMLQRLKGIGLLCGTDWTKLYNNRFYYSRLDHSIGVALIIWHFTQDKAQTIAGLLHDVSTPVFSHVSDFRKGDALTQTATEAPNEGLIRGNKQLLELLRRDGLLVEQVEDYHKYPVADNEIPQLSADRLEYMFPSGMALDGSWDLPSIERAYKDIEILTNEDNLPELGFNTVEIAEDYTYRFCMIGHILQLNENKLTLQLLGQIMNLAVEEGLIPEEAFMKNSEAEVFELLENQLTDNKHPYINKLLNTFKNMTCIEHTDKALDENEYFCVSLKVKQRYINPLVKVMREDGSFYCKRLSEVSEKTKNLIKDFLSYEDRAYGCVKMV